MRKVCKMKLQTLKFVKASSGIKADRLFLFSTHTKSTNEIKATVLDKIIFKLVHFQIKPPILRDRRVNITTVELRNNPGKSMNFKSLPVCDCLLFLVLDKEMILKNPEKMKMHPIRKKYCFQPVCE